MCPWILFFPQCQEFAGQKRDYLMKATPLPLAMQCTSAEGSSQARIQMAPVALWDLNTVLFPPVGMEVHMPMPIQHCKSSASIFGRFQA